MTRILLFIICISHYAFSVSSLFQTKNLTLLIYFKRFRNYHENKLEIIIAIHELIILVKEKKYANSDFQSATQWRVTGLLTFTPPESSGIMSVPSHLKDYPPNAVSIKEEEVSFTEHQRQTDRDRETEKETRKH